MSSNQTTAKATTSQPQAANAMNIMNVPTASNGKQQHEHKASRIRGGGAGRDCFLGAIECFLCFECCKDCCECVADIICCPCEMCC